MVGLNSVFSKSFYCSTFDLVNYSTEQFHHLAKRGAAIEQGGVESMMWATVYFCCCFANKQCFFLI